jgi:hypothetical protein
MRSRADRSNALHAREMFCFGSKLQEAGHARMAELADAPDLGSGGEILVGSSPSPGICSEVRQTKTLRSVANVSLARTYGSSGK